VKKSKPPRPEPKPHSTSNPNPKSKSAPQELSSKRPVSRKHFLPNTTQPTRDPRFETLSTPTVVPASTLRASYSFLEDYQRDEIVLLKTQIRATRDPEARAQLEKTLQSLQSRREAREKKVRAEGVLQERKREEKDKVAKGKRPFYLKRKEERRLVLEERYSGLGKKRLDKVLEKKRKKKEGKEMRKMPRQR
jgi:ribosomal RNA-processing protein 36